MLPLVLLTAIAAEVAPVSVRVPEPTGWVGQRIPFYVDLRAPGSFAGTASFALPAVPGSLMIKIGDPLVETESIGGATWFVQRHEFALFSQRPGSLEIPAFTVRFARREGYSGPASDVEGTAEGLAFEIRRPPGSERVGFLVTTEELDITETWAPEPGPADVGAVFKRTIVQQAPQVTGMALAPVPEADIDGVRVYPGEATTRDQLARGAFLGERRETITYLIQEPGVVELPAVTYVWWNPRTESLESRTLPAVAIDVAAPPPDQAARTGSESGILRTLAPWFALIITVGLLAWQRRRIEGWMSRIGRSLHPPDRVAARRLLRACHENDPAAAGTAWAAWRNTRPSGFEADRDLRSAVMEMQRHRFGRDDATAWQGGDLARAFREANTPPRAGHRHARDSPLPPMNPR